MKQWGCPTALAALAVSNSSTQGFAMAHTVTLSTVSIAIPRCLPQELDQERDALKHQQKELRCQHKSMQVGSVS
jgi:hypothetical protein